MDNGKALNDIIRVGSGRVGGTGMGWERAARAMEGGALPVRLALLEAVGSAPAGPSALAARLRISPQRAGVQLANLAAAGLVDCAEAWPRRDYTLTEAGRRVLALARGLEGEEGGAR